jgi:hypothetical protein
MYERKKEKMYEWKKETKKERLAQHPALVTHVHSTLAFLYRVNVKCCRHLWDTHCVLFQFRPRRRRQHVPPKGRQHSPHLHGEKAKWRNQYHKWTAAALSLKPTIRCSCSENNEPWATEPGQLHKCTACANLFINSSRLSSNNISVIINFPTIHPSTI